MKTMKFFAMASALAAMVGFSSCLNGGDYTNTASGATFVKVSGYLGINSLKDELGFEYVPSNKENITNLTSGKYAYIVYTYDPTTVDYAQKAVNINLAGYSILTDEQVVANAPVAENANAPVYSVYDMSTSSQYRVQPVFYQKRDVFIPIYYYYKPANSSEDLQKERVLHHFTLYYDATTDFTSSTMTLHLRHTIQDFDAEENEKRTSYDYEFRHFNLNSALSQYQAANGGQNPDKIVIEFEQNRYNADYGKDDIESKSYEIDYKTVVENYDKLAGSTTGSGSNE